MNTIEFNYEAPPTVAKFLRSDAFHKAIKGPVGSGKSVGCCVEIFRRNLQMPAWNGGLRTSKWAIVRNTMKELRNTTLETWMKWMGDLGVWQESKFQFHLKFGEVDSKILFLPLDSPGDIGRLLSLELTGLWINESREVPITLLQDIKGRLGRYPAYKDCPENFQGPWFKDPSGEDTLWYYAGLLCDTNPPEIDTPWYRLFEKLPQEENDEGSIIDCDVFSQPSGLSAEAENKENLRPGYYESLAKGNTKTWIDTYIHGKYSPSMAGKPVYHNSFKQEKHAAIKPLSIDPFLPVIIGFDCGLTPAAAFFQMSLEGRVKLLREAAAFDMGMKRFAINYLRPIIKNFFPTNPLVFIGDPAGSRRADSDESSAFKVLKELFDCDNVRVRAAATNDPTQRIQALEQALCQYPEGDPLLQIDPSCKRFKEGLRSKYRYPVMKMSGNYSDKPEKNDASHLIEAGQYGLLFLLSGKYDPTDYMQDREFNPLSSYDSYRPALREGY